MNRIKKWWLEHIHGVGRVVYWDNKYDCRFTGEYIVTTKIDKKGFVGIYNDKVGNRLVPLSYLQEIYSTVRCDY